MVYPRVKDNAVFPLGFGAMRLPMTATGGIDYVQSQAMLEYAIESGVNYLDTAMVVKVLANRRSDLHIVVTGRNAREPLVEIADLVTSMDNVKHHFAAGVKAQKGIEF